MKLKLNHIVAVLAMIAPLAGCGVPQSSHTKIIGGTAVTPHEAIASSVVAMVNDAGDVFCTVVAVAPKVFLTAGHCIGADDLISNFKLRRGLHVASSIQSSDEPVKIKSWKRHEQFDWTAMVTATPSRPPHDIGMIMTEEDMVGVVPASIAAPSDQLTVGTTVNISGYGRSIPDDDASRGILLEFPFEISSVSNLALEFEVIDKSGSQNHMACNGDSGGPVYREKDGHVILYGLVSRGRNTCVGDRTVVTNAVAHATWIQQQ